MVNNPPQKYPIYFVRSNIVNKSNLLSVIYKSEAIFQMEN